jgi:hypothetical protein
MTVDYSPEISRLSQQSAELQTSINIGERDIAEIDAERKTTRAAWSAARAAGNTAEAERYWAQIQALDDEWGKVSTRLANDKIRKTEVDGNIRRLQTRQQELAAADKVPTPVSDTNNPANPTGPTSTITQNTTTTVPDPNVATERPIDDPTGVFAAEDAALAAQAVADDDAAIFRLNEPVADPYGVFAAEDAALAEEAAAAGDAEEFERSSAVRSSTGALNDTRSVATKQDAVSFEKAKDWRVRLSLAPSAKYLYKADNPGILKALQATNGVIFPYTPTVSVGYTASYSDSDLTHSNYKIYNYKNSSVDTVSITGDFTAQDTNEANYLLAVIHFFKSVTKMFYGQDENPRNGTPPPLVYMSGLGTFQFDNHPLAVTNFTYSLPNEVDYIRVGSQTNEPGSSTSGQTAVNNTDNASSARIESSNLGPKVPNFQRQQSTINSDATYVPTKMQIAITCIPIVTRNDISNNFSLKKYATGELLQGSKRNGGGIW